MSRRTTLATALLCTAWLAHAADGALPITVQGAGPHYRLTLPVAAYALSPGNGLYDLRVHNAAGQAIPFAWVRNDTVEHTTATRAVPIFPLPIDSTSSPANTALAFAILANGALQPVSKVPAASDLAKDTANNWLMDVSQIRGRLLQAHFAIAAQQSGVFAFQLQASDDLKQWHNVGGQEQLLRLQHDGQTIERLTMDLGSIQSHFLRLRWLDAQHGATLTKVTIDSVDDIEPPPALQWTDALAPEQCGSDYCDYRVPSGAPASRLKVSLGQSNTLSTIRLYGMATTGTAQPRPLYHHHNPLYALRRHKHQLIGSDAQGESLLTEAVVYRLSYPQGEVVSEPIELNGSSWDTLRLRTTGPIAALGATPPKLSLAVPLKTLVFLGQGGGPYSVAVADGSDAKQRAAGAPVALSTLIPNYKPELLSAIEQATVAVPAAVPAQATAAAPSEPAPKKRYWLWAALVAGLVLLGGMAWSLLRGLPKAGG